MALTARQVRQRLTALNLNSDQIREIAELVSEVSADNTTNLTSINNLNAWATALATKLNADAGVTDTNYDTDPQA